MAPEGTFLGVVMVPLQVGFSVVCPSQTSRQFPLNQFSLAQRGSRFGFWEGIGLFNAGHRSVQVLKSSLNGAGPSG